MEQKAREARSPRGAPGGATALRKRGHLEELQESHRAGKRSRLEKAREDAGKSPVRTPEPQRLREVAAVMAAKGGQRRSEESLKRERLSRIHL